MTRFVSRQDGGTLQQVCVRMSRDSHRMARIDHGPVTRLGWQGSCPARMAGHSNRCVCVCPVTRIGWRGSITVERRVTERRGSNPRPTAFTSPSLTNCATLSPIPQQKCLQRSGWEVWWIRGFWRSVPNLPRLCTPFCTKSSRFEDYYEPTGMQDPLRFCTRSWPPSTKLSSKPILECQSQLSFCKRPAAVIERWRYPCISPEPSCNPN